MAEENAPLKTFKRRKILLPIGIGLIAVGYLVYSNFKQIDMNQIASAFGQANKFWIFMAFLCLVIKVGGYSFRLYHLTMKEVTKLGSFFVVILWEFASAVTPSVVGGTAISIFFINKEGVPLGKSLAYILLTAVLDNMFFVIFSLLTLATLPDNVFPDISSLDDGGGQWPVKELFILSVSLITIYTSFMAFGLFVSPKAVKWFLVKVTTPKFMNRFSVWAAKTGDDLVLAAETLKGRGFFYWFKIVSSTILVWVVRYIMVNCLIAAFMSVSFNEHLVIFGRQVVSWVVMLVSPTPGAAGAATLTFKAFYGEFFTVPGLVIAVATLWRLFSYYVYLLVGALVLPRWLNRVMSTPKPEADEA